MSRKVCFFDEEGQTAICLAECLQQEICCSTCEHNPFPNKIVPEDRVLRIQSDKPKIVKKHFDIVLSINTEGTEDIGRESESNVERYFQQNNDFVIKDGRSETHARIVGTLVKKVWKE